MGLLMLGIALFIGGVLAAGAGFSEESFPIVFFGIWVAFGGSYLIVDCIEKAEMEYSYVSPKKTNEVILTCVNKEKGKTYKIKLARSEDGYWAEDSKEDVKTILNEFNCTAEIVNEEKK
jgi:hypothetical protein